MTNAHTRPGMSPIEIRDRLISLLQKLGKPKASLISVLAGIDGDEHGFRFNTTAAVNYRKKYSRANKPQIPNASQIATCNAQLLAPACFIYGEAGCRWRIPTKSPNDPTDTEWPLAISGYSKGMLQELSKLKADNTNLGRDALLKAWLLQSAVATKIGLPTSSSDRSGIRARQDIKQLETAFTKVLAELAKHVSDLTPVLLVICSDQAESKIQDTADLWHGHLIHKAGNCRAIRFIHDDQYIMPAIRAMMVAHKLFCELGGTRRKRAQKQKPQRLLLLKSPIDLEQAKNRAATAGQLLRGEAMASHADTAYLDTYVWSTLGVWANADRQAPQDIEALSSLGDQWAKLDNFGQQREPFTETIIPPAATGCFSEEEATLHKTWQAVSQPKKPEKKRAKIIQIDGPDGSGKHPLLESFLNTYEGDTAKVVGPLRFSSAGLNSEIQPLVDSINQAFGIDPKQTLQDRTETLEREIKRRRGDVSKKQLATFVEAQSAVFSEGSAIVSPSSTHKTLMRLIKDISNIAQEAIRCVASMSPLIIAATDLHRAGEPARRIFLDICQQIDTNKALAELPILVIYTTRPELIREYTERCTFSPLQISLGNLSQKQTEHLTHVFRKSGTSISDQEVENFLADGSPTLGRFVSRLVRAGGKLTRRQQCSTALACILRPHATQPTLDHTTHHACSVGALVLMSFIGGHVYPATLASLLLSHPEIEAQASSRNSKQALDIATAFIEDLLEHAKSSGMLETGRGGSTHERLYHFRNQNHAVWLRREIILRFSKSIEGNNHARVLADMLIRDNAEPSISHWESAAQLMKCFAGGERKSSEYWHRAGDTSLRMGDPKSALRQFKYAYHAAAKPIREGSGSKDDLEWVTEAFRRYLYAARLQDVTPDPAAEKRYQEYAQKSGAIKRASRFSFNTWLCLWHLADIRANHTEAYSNIKRIRRAIEYAESRRGEEATIQQHRELAYAAWATSISRGQLYSACRYYGQLLTLRVLGNEEDDVGVTLSSGHDLEFYAPARHAAVHWLMGDYSGIYELKRMLLNRLRQLPPEDVFRQFWASAYFIPVAMFLGWDDVVDQFMPYVRDEACTKLGGTMSGISSLLELMRTVPRIDDPKDLKDVLFQLGYRFEQDLKQVKVAGEHRRKPGHAGKHNVGLKHHSVWISLVARRWLELGDRQGIADLADALDQAISACTANDELFLMAELYRLRALTHHALDEPKKFRTMLNNAIRLSSQQGASTIEIESHRNKLTLCPDQHSRNRLKHLYTQCDFPINHPAANKIKVTHGLKAEADV